MGVAWITCPLQAAIRVAKIGVLTLGWTRVKIDLLKKRPVQCYKCWHYGHVRSSCRSDIDRVGGCFRCGNVGHTIKACRSSIPSCLICKDKGCESRHKMGSVGCLKNQGYPSGTQPVKKIAPNTRRASQASAVTVFYDQYDRRD